MYTFNNSIESINAYIDFIELVDRVRAGKDAPYKIDDLLDDNDGLVIIMADNDFNTQEMYDYCKEVLADEYNSGLSMLVKRIGNVL